MSLIITRANPTNWVAGNLLTAVQINTVDQNPVTVAEYVEGQRADVKLYGALGDNSTDDSAAIQDAADAAAAADIPIYFPPGDYRFNGIVWGTHSIIGIPNEVSLRCNSTTNPLFTSTTNNGDSSSIYNAKTVYGVHCDFVSTSNNGLFIVQGQTRVVFDSCNFDTEGSTAVGIGAVHLGGTTRTTHAAFRNCSFMLDGDNDSAVGRDAASTKTFATLTDCRIRVNSTTRNQTYKVLNADVLKVENCYLELSGSSTATSLKVFGGEESISVTGTTVTDIASGDLYIYNQGASCFITEAGNHFPSSSTALRFPTDPVDWNVASRNRAKAVTQSGGGTLLLDTREYDFFMVEVGDTTAFSISASTAPDGTEFDIMLWSGAGSPTGTITWGSSYFWSFATTSNGYGMPAVITPGTVASARFRRGNRDGTERWFLIGSGVVYP